MSLGNVRAAARALLRARLRVIAAEAGLATSVREALAEGHAATAIAAAAGLSRQRVYQIRDGRR